MDASNHKEVVKNIIQNLIEKLGFFADISVSQQEGSQQDSFLGVIKVSEGQNFLIGQYGMNLAALQHIVRILARRAIGEKLDIVVDVNNYFSDKSLLLEKEAQEALRMVLQSNASVTLRPMLPYERKIIHAFLAANEGVETESVGKGEERRVLIRPRSMVAA